MNLENKILYEDNHLLIVNKPCGLLAQGDKTQDICLLDLSKAYIKEKYHKPGNVYLGLPHRLDRPVSGITILSKTSKALTRMNEIFKNRKITKTYHAIVTHEPKPHQATLIHYLKKFEKLNFAKVYSTAAPGTVQAKLHYHLLVTKDHNHLLELNLETGRHHQIRAQLSAIGCAIYGDKKYGSKFYIDRHSIALHCRSCTFDHPISNEKLNIVAKYPNKKIWQHFK